MGSLVLDITSPVCRFCNEDVQRWQQCEALIYEFCERCRMIQLSETLLPTIVEEKSCYDLHENMPSDPAYRRFLSRLSTPLLEYISLGDRGLDYGCGPGPAMAAMLTEQGFPTSNYDPIYYPDSLQLQKQFDFITCSEVVEHFHYPASSFKQLYKLLKPGAWLAIMTSWWSEDQDFCRWHYRRDPTHVCFYSSETFDFLADTMGFELRYAKKNAVILQKQQ